MTATIMYPRMRWSPTSRRRLRVLKKYYKYDEATGKFTNFPTLTYLYNTGESSQGNR